MTPGSAAPSGEPTGWLLHLYRLPLVVMAMAAIVAPFAHHRLWHAHHHVGFGFIGSHCSRAILIMPVVLLAMLVWAIARPFAYPIAVFPIALVTIITTMSLGHLPGNLESYGVEGVDPRLATTLQLLLVLALVNVPAQLALYLWAARRPRLPAMPSARATRRTWLRGTASTLGSARRRR